MTLFTFHCILGILHSDSWGIPLPKMVLQLKFIFNSHLMTIYVYPGCYSVVQCDITLSVYSHNDDITLPVYSHIEDTTLPVYSHNDDITLPVYTHISAASLTQIWPLILHIHDGKHGHNYLTHP